MRSIFATLFRLAAGVLAGAAISICGLVAMAAFAAILDGKMPEIQKPDTTDIIVLLVYVGAGAANGAVGATAGAVFKSKAVWPVLIIPLVLFSFPQILTIVMHGRLAGEALILLIPALTAYVGGRIGQRLGFAEVHQRDLAKPTPV